MAIRQLLLALLAWSSLWATEPYLPGVPFVPDRLEILWKAPAKDMPTHLWVYEEKPAEFPPSVISNLMALGSFTKADRKKVSIAYPLKQKSLIHFESKGQTRVLDIIPDYGWIDYFDNAATAIKREPIQGVPGPEEAVDLALRYLPKVGIDRAHLASKPQSSELKLRVSIRNRSWFDKEQGKPMKVPESIGVNFTRQLDGLEFAGGWGSGGFWMDFGNDGKVAGLKVSWRNLQHAKSFPVASTRQIIEQIEQGKATMLRTDMDSKAISKLVIKSVTPFYWAGYGYKHQGLVYPFAVLEASAQLSRTNVSLELNCPIIIEN